MAANSGGDMVMEVHYGTVEQIAGDIKVRRELLERQLDALWGAVTKVDDAWEGDARQAFNIIKRKWDQRVNSLTSTLTRMETTVRNGKDQYHATDKKAASFFDDLAW
ncbi:MULTISPECIES: WXG100 family type VII secretion target [unclassified Streptomyces]|uniref:WXG100 family type VII secretion target n=1 Tax=unclassified Streptomyces TaxID=2593676 RepID=UPI002DDC710C|nr:MULTISPECIES: WXG100 family type VII secretion target [unclassified Streptomyces]WSA92033.1 WXG100 family type VII secretion target [Streptomyces sp. NBC_01795]WSB76400.1 WXG100 family type VII secretion target [Streptomyces sp. NBC_01775]WSS15325.1 WXG100 family type VII secretion target [Streptomyces sp. NBC_01186]WSS44170.1 WXG100 family type VII secretion target [Streptomyces sp. NBC_01187]